MADTQTRRRPRILVVDDNPEILDMVQRILRLEGYAVDVAGDGCAALDLAAKNDPDMVLLDVMMPGLDGLQVLAELRQRSDVPVIMITARREPETTAAMLLAGADDYLTKPFGAKELVARIKAKLRRAHPGSGQSTTSPAAPEMRPERRRAE